MIKINSVFKEELTHYKDYLCNVDVKIIEAKEAGLVSLTIPADIDQYNAIKENKKYSDLSVSWNDNVVSFNW